ALHAHWERRRLDPVEVAARAATAGSGGWWQRIFGSKKGAGARPRPRGGALQNFLWRTELARLFGARQARYMMRMVQMFERGDLDAALRHAVPFNVFGAGATHLALGTPKPRADLNFLGPRGAGGGGFALPPQIKELLTKHYRDAHETLAGQNRLDEAAFVLAELLDSPAEATQFLEKHQKWRTAAQLCEARELETGLAVRLWWLAGERERAVAVARRSNAFADAVARLERGDRTQREAARSLRLLWAHHCALAGDFAGAVEAAWPVLPHVPEARGVVGAWIERGLEGHGVAAAQMLARQAHFLDQLSPATLENWRARTLQLLENGDEESVNLRLRFADLLCAAPSGELARAAARRTIRALARDGAQFPAWSAALKTQTKSLLDFASDGPLRVDVARHTFPAAPPRLETRTEPLSFIFEADDAGSLDIHDAALLPDGRALVALGEGGARLLHRDGKTLAVFDQPCHRLVMSPNGERAIGVALRGLEFAARFSGDKAALDEFIGEMGVNEFHRRTGVARLCRFDLARKTAQFWGEIAELRAHSTHFETGGWLVASGDAILSLDPTASGPLALWQTRDAGFAACLGRDDHSLAMLTHFYERNRRVRSEVWRFELPSLTLRERRLVAPEDGDAATGIAPNGCLLVGRDANAKPAVVTGYEKKITAIDRAQDETILQSEVCGSWLAALSLVDEGVVIRLSRNILLRAQIT
ncbi:MAG: hypothetical protein KY445_17290, partial [Armatimonadetes bacterium]|nr:hypothetical protein [Armatimonadota bacterium]